MTPDTQLENQHLKLKSKMVRGEPSKTYQLSDTESSYLVGSKKRSRHKRSEASSSDGSGSKARYHEGKRRRRRPKRSSTPPPAGQISNRRNDNPTARRRLNFGANPAEDTSNPNPMMGEIQRLRDDMKRLQVSGHRGQRTSSYHGGR